EEGLTQDVFVAAVDGGGATAVGRGGGTFEVFAGEGVEGELLHGSQCSHARRSLTRAMRGRSWRPPPPPGRPYRGPRPPRQWRRAVDTAAAAPGAHHARPAGGDRAPAAHPVLARPDVRALGGGPGRRGRSAAAGHGARHPGRGWELLAIESTLVCVTAPEWV